MGGGLHAVFDIKMSSCHLTSIYVIIRFFESGKQSEADTFICSKKLRQYYRPLYMLRNHVGYLNNGRDFTSQAG